MKHYVLGFVFNRSRTKVLLIHKNNTDELNFLNGKWNGIGGKIKNTDANHYAAMQRECAEEIGVPYYWKHAITYSCLDGTVFVYCAFSHHNSANGGVIGIYYKQIEEEELKIWQLDSLPDNIDPDLKWLIPILLSPIRFPLLVERAF